MVGLDSYLDFPTGDQASIIKNGRVYSIFNIQWLSERPPRHLTDIYLDIKGSILSEDRTDKYFWDYCDRFLPEFIHVVP